MISENKQIFEKCHARPNQGTEYSYKINQQNMYFFLIYEQIDIHLNIHTVDIQHPIVTVPH